MTKQSFCSCLLFMCSLTTQAQFVPVTRNANIATSDNFPVNAGGLSYYVRTSVYGLGQDGGENGSDNYDIATSFAEAGIRANYKYGFDEGYVIIAAEGRLRHGQYFNGKLKNSANPGQPLNSNDRYETTLDLRDLYVGYRGRKWEVLLGNQNIQWGRGMGSNPTNNLSASDLFFLSAGADDGKMYNLMLSADYQINKGLDLQVVGAPFVKTSKMPLSLFKLGGLNLGDQEVPEAKIKNGSVAARLNLQGMQCGASISYFNGYDPFPTLKASLQESGEPEAHTVLCRKQTIGADFSYTFAAKPRGGNFVPANSFTVFGEFGYNIYKKEGGAGYVPQNNLAFNIGARKLFFMRNNVDMMMISASWYGKYTPNFKELTNNTEDMEVYLYETNQTLSRFFNGQQKALDHSAMVVVSQSLARQKVNLSAMCSLGLIKPSGFMDDTKGDQNMTLNVQGVYNISNNLSATLGYRRMFGSSAPMYGPVMGGAFAELKAKF